jgi:perosamine synthetase
MSFEPGAAGPKGSIPLCVPQMAGREWEYVKECLDTNWVSSVGPFVDRFESSVADFVGAQYGVATSSGTAALHIALLAAGVQPDDEVLVSNLTFIAPANAIRYTGAWPILIDAEPDYWQMDVQKLSDFLTDKCDWRDGLLTNKSTGRRVRAILPVHILGHPVDMDPLLELARHFQLIVIEDSTESLGATYKGRPTGHLGDIGCFSFNGNKIVTAGGGGMIVTDNKEYAARAKYLSTQAKDDSIEYIHNEVGFNYRLTNVQAAIGCAQMELLPTFIERKRHIANRYSELLSRVVGLKTMPRADWAEPVYWLYTILMDASSRDCMRKLAKSSIQARPLWQPLHQSPVYKNLQVEGGSVAENLNKRALSLPSSVSLTDAEIDEIVSAIIS